MFPKILSLAILILISDHVSPARILAIIPTACYSHQIFFQPLWRELAIRGHDMVVITSDPTGEQLPNFQEVSISESYKLTKPIMDALTNENIFKLLLTDKMVQMFDNMLSHQLALPQIQEIINNQTEHFDLLLVEHNLNVYFAFRHRFNCPVIGIRSMDAFPKSHEVMGNPVHHILYPITLLPFQEDMSFLQRIAAFSMIFLTEWLYLMNSEKMMSLAKKYFGEDIPNLMNLWEETDMLFVNANPLFVPMRPHTPSTINIAGGLHMKPPGPLPKDLKQFLDDAKEGVIYFSLGSNVKSKEMSIDLRQTILETLAQLPYKVLWKFEDDTLPGKPENVKIIKWSPQQDVLRHKNVKLFITQGGLQSLEEALYSHMPLVVMPFITDQVPNAAKVKSKGLGLVVDRHNLKVEEFRAAILEVLTNPVYKENAVKLATQIQDEPMTPLDKAIWWTEYVLRHKGAKHLKGPRIPFYQYYYLDILALLAGVGLVIMILLVKIIKLMIKCIRWRYQVKSQLAMKYKVKTS